MTSLPTNYVEHGKYFDWLEVEQENFGDVGACIVGLKIFVCYKSSYCQLIMSEPENELEINSDSENENSVSDNSEDSNVIHESNEEENYSSEEGEAFGIQPYQYEPIVPENVEGDNAAAAPMEQDNPRLNNTDWYISHITINTT